MEFAFVFPGQGAQSPGMLDGLAGLDRLVRDTCDEASAALGYDLWQVIQADPEARLNRTEVTQPALLTAGVAAWRLWQARGGRGPACMAGHSLGEYTALVCAGALDFAEAVTLVRDRGLYMQEAVPESAGGMAAVLGLEAGRVEAVCRQAEAESGAAVSAANYNSPEQTVIAGQAAAVARAMELAREAGAKRVLPLPVSVPSHCRLMKPAAERLAERLRQVALRDAAVPVVQNVDARERRDAGPIGDGLVEQLYRPVRWVDTVQRLRQLGCGLIVEAAPGRVLGGLVKRIDRDMKTLNLESAASFENALKELEHGYQT